MSKTYAIADLHGRFDLLEMALVRIAERVEPSATLVTLGDYVDRGLDSREVIERLMAGLGRDGWRLKRRNGDGNLRRRNPRRFRGRRRAAGGLGGIPSAGREQ